MMRIMLPLCVGALLGACGATSAPPTSTGQMKLSLTQVGPGTGGAIVVTISGGVVSAVHAPAGFDVVSNTDGRGTHVILIGPLNLGDLATIDVPDSSKATIYVATVDQVADGSTFALLDARTFKVAMGIVK